MPACGPAGWRGAAEEAEVEKEHGVGDALDLTVAVGVAADELRGRRERPLDSSITTMLSITVTPAGATWLSSPSEDQQIRKVTGVSSGHIHEQVLRRVLTRREIRDPALEQPGGGIEEPMRYHSPSTAGTSRSRSRNRLNDLRKVGYMYLFTCGSRGCHAFIHSPEPRQQSEIGEILATVRLVLVLVARLRTAAFQFVLSRIVATLSARLRHLRLPKE